jgi:hypothetical protein
VAELQGCADLVAELLVRVGDRLEVGAGVEVAAGGDPIANTGPPVAMISTPGMSTVSSSATY